VNLPPLSFTVLDTETTGLIPKVHRIIEFACVRVEQGQVTDTYETLFALDGDIPPTVEVLTRIHTSDLTGKPKIHEQRDEILEHIGSDTVIIGQNVGFDLAMLKGEGIDLTDRLWLDTSMIASLVFPELESYSLAYVSTVLKLNHAPVHRALGDVHATLELLSRCWERLCQLPTSLHAETIKMMHKSSKAYQLFFGALPPPKAQKKPTWLHRMKNGKLRMGNGTTLLPLSLPKPTPGTVDLLEEPLDPSFLQRLVESCNKDSTTTHWIAVKNLEATIRRLTIPSQTRVLYPPFLLTDPDACTTLIHQEKLTSEESTLALKYQWYHPHSQSDLPIHGDERSVWAGKIACTDVSPIYQEQFKDLPSTILLDHRQLLAFLRDPAHTAHGALSRQSHIIIDDASMLEDTATKAYSAFVPIEALRASAESHPRLMQFTDTVQLLVEKLRTFRDLAILRDSDIHTSDVRGLREHLVQIMNDSALPSQTLALLRHLQEFLTLEQRHPIIRWIEQQPNGNQHLHAAPEHIGHILHESLYQRFSTTLLIPPRSANTLTEILPKTTETSLVPPSSSSFPFTLSFPQKQTIESILMDPPEGKTVILMQSHRAIEQCFVQHTERLEKKGITLFCQGLGGGQSRMQAEFAASTDPSILLLSPWRYEILELPPSSVDQLIIDSLPFDSPSHPVFERRCGHFRNSFEEYSLPRLEQRLFRIVRKFFQHARPQGEILVTDVRISTKEYGKRIRKYLERIEQGDESSKQSEKQMTLF